MLTRGLICTAVCVMQWQCDASRELLAPTVAEQAVSSHPPSHAQIARHATSSTQRPVLEHMMRMRFPQHPRILVVCTPSFNRQATKTSGWDLCARANWFI